MTTLEDVLSVRESLKQGDRLESEALRLGEDLLEGRLGEGFAMRNLWTAIQSNLVFDFP